MGKKKTKKTNVREEIVSAALGLAAQGGWEDVALHDVAEACGMSLEDLCEVIDCKDDILVLFVRMVDKKMLAVVESGQDVVCDSARERIFDLLMERYDVLNQRREGFKAIIRSFRSDPKQAVFVMPQIARSMSRVLDSAGVETSGVAGTLKVAGLTGIYLRGLKVWADDESEDLSKTMAALDKALGHGEAVVNSFGL